MLHELFDSKCVGCIREAVKVDKRERGGKHCTSESFDSHGEHLQVTGCYPVLQIMFHCLWVRFCISNPWQIVYGAFPVDAKEKDGGGLFLHPAKTWFEVKAQRRGGVKKLHWCAAVIQRHVGLEMLFYHSCCSDWDSRMVSVIWKTLLSVRVLAQMRLFHHLSATTG